MRCHASCASCGSGNRPTARCGTWCAAGCCTRCGLSRDWAEYERPQPVVPDNRPVRGPLRELLPLEFQQVRRSEQEPLFDSLIEQYHYLRYQQPVGEHLKYLVSAKGQVIACLAWSSAVRHLASGDRFIGWGA